MISPKTVRIVQAGAAAVALLFGAVTVFAGGRVLLGADPGYAVFRPLLVFNTGMGLAYLAAGVTIWRSLGAGRFAAGAIALLNLTALAVVFALYSGAGTVAVESLRAMTLRAAVWLLLFLVVAWLARGRTAGRKGPG